MNKNRHHFPIRTCLGCNNKKDKFSLIRFVFQDKSDVKIDPGQTEPGHGHYLCPDSNCVTGFIQSRRIRKLTPAISQQQKQNINQQFLAMVLPNRIQSLIGLARRAGKAAIGQQAVEAAIKKRQARLVIIAEDASQNTKDDFQKLATKFDRDLKIVGLKADWGKLFGREETAVLAIVHQQFARAVKEAIGGK